MSFCNHPEGQYCKPCAEREKKVREIAEKAGIVLPEKKIRAVDN